MKQEEHVTIYRKDYTVPAYLVDSIHLTVKLHEEYTDVLAKMDICKNPESSDEGGVLVLDGENLDLLGVKLDGRELSEEEYTLTERSLAVDVGVDRVLVEVTTRIDPDGNTALEGLYRSSGNYCTQCEAEGFRKITYYIDRPDNLAKFTTRIEGDRNSCPVLLSNGNKVDDGELEGGRHYAVWEDPFPKPCYLFALVAGDLVHIEDTYTTGSGRNIDLRIYVEKRNIDKCDHAMRSLKKSMQWDEEVFGLEYDLDIYMIVAVDDFNMGAMENKGLNIFNSKYILASQETATDTDYLGIEGVVAHEYFHNWTGNRVTCRDWFQLSLKEGLTVFRDQEFSSDMNSRPVQRIDDVRILRTHQFREDGGPMAHPVRPDSYVEINNFYTVTVYNKGAEVIRMMHTLLGPDGFRRGMDLYFERHDGDAVTCDDFASAMADANDYDLDQFKLWYSQSGTPEIEVRCSYNGSEKEYSVTIEQNSPPTPSQPEKAPFHIPLAVGFLDGEGRDIRITEEETLILELKEKKEHFVFKGFEEKPVLSFLRNFSAPVKVKPFHSVEELSFIMAHDSDLYNRWEASSQLAEKLIFENVERLQRQEEPKLDEQYVAAVKKLISEEGPDKSLLAQALHLPSETYLASMMEEIDPQNLYKARRFVQQQLAGQLFEDFTRLYTSNGNSVEYEPTPEAMGRRALKNAALGYLMSPDSPGKAVLEACAQQYHEGTNMTDVISALGCIANIDTPLRKEVLGDFHMKWKADPLVMDKWFIIQATSRLEGTLEEVKELMLNESFSIKNPNKVRSLIGAFCSMNHVRFHDSSGEGYEFLADRILQLDSLNPQVAARMVTPFTTWKKYDGERQLLIRDQLERIVRSESLSGDVYEIVKKSL